jgi:hypothetical protein
MIYRAHGLRVVIFGDNYEPAHVHGQARINRAGLDGVPELVCGVGMKRNKVRRAMQLVINQGAFVGRWREIDG